MRSFRRVALLPVLIAGVMAFSGCPSGTTVSRINSDPGRYRNREVALTGRVTDSWGIAGTGAYQIDDGTGSIWVSTTQGVPARGARVGVRGTVRTSFVVAGRSFGTIIQETGRKNQTR